MIEEKTAVEIATRFLCLRGVDVEEFAQATYIPERSIWACCFFNKMPVGGLDSPGMTIVDVDCSTGEPSFFDTM